MKRFKEYFNDVYDFDPETEVMAFANAGGREGQYDNFLAEPFVGIASAGGSEGQYARKGKLKESSTADSKIIHLPNDEVFIDHEKSNEGLSNPRNSPEKLKIIDHHGSGYVHPHFSDEQAHNVVSVHNNTDHDNLLYHPIVHAYTRGSDNLNNTLWEHFKSKTTPPSSIAANLHNNVHIHLDHMDRLIAKHQLPHDMHVYTGLHLNPRDHPDKQLVLPAYTSTSVTPHVAKDFGKYFYHTDKYGNHEVIKHILKIHLSKGFHHLSTDKGSLFPGQGEIILPRNLRLHVDDKPSHIITGSFNNHFSDKRNEYVEDTYHVWNARLLPHKK